jgi:organic radical activating enzyme
MRFSLPYRVKEVFHFLLNLFGIRPEFYSCIYISDAIVFRFNNMVHCCCHYSFIKENGVLAQVGDDNLVESIEASRRKLLDNHRRGIHMGCLGCPDFQKRRWVQSPKLHRVVLSHFLACNLKCEHCGYVRVQAKTTRHDTKHEDVLDALKVLYKRGMIDRETCFDQGGGEPSIQVGLEKILEFVLSQGNIVHMNSNGTRYSDFFAKGCLEDRIRLTLTPDAGSREVYKTIKGADYFDQVWENISRYVETTKGKVEVKILLEEGNLGDVDNMLRMLVISKVKRFKLDMDLNIKPVDYRKYAYPIGYIRKACQEHGIEISRGPFVPSGLWK